jgi:hypothetical protein
LHASKTAGRDCYQWMWFTVPATIV